MSGFEALETACNHLREAHSTIDVRKARNKCRVLTRKINKLEAQSSEENRAKHVWMSTSHAWEHRHWELMRAVRALSLARYSDVL